MRGYKGMNKDMKCRDMQYEVGKTYHADGKIELCENGLHFCKNLRDVFNFYDREDGNRFFEIEAEEIDTDRKKSVTDELTVVRELSEIEINQCYYGDGYGDGNGYGDDYGNGYGDGYGDGDGDGYGDGYGYGDGNGYGNGNGKNIQKILDYCA